MIQSKTVFPFRTVSLSDAKNKLAEVLDQVIKGERIGITRRGKLAAVMIPADSKAA